jgi:hypothetical protein
LPFLAVLLLLLTLLRPTLLPFLAGTLLFLPALLPALLLFGALLGASLWLRCLPLFPAALSFLLSLFLTLLSLLLALLASGLVFLSPLLTTATPSLRVGKVARSQQRGGYR